MDYKIQTNKGDLNSTGYIEIGSGKYNFKHWNDGFIFVWEDTFGFAEGIIEKHFPDYDHFSMNDIPVPVAEKIEIEWEEASKSILASSATESADILNLEASFHSRMEEELTNEKNEISIMLHELSGWMKRFRENQDWVCILGV